MIKVTLTNEMLRRISAIEENRFSARGIHLPAAAKNRLRKNSRKKSSYASNKIEGNPLTEAQAAEVIERDPHRHFLKPEQEIRNYFLALNLLEEKLKRREPFSVDLGLAGSVHWRSFSRMTRKNITRRFRWVCLRCIIPGGTTRPIRRYGSIIF